MSLSNKCIYIAACYMFTTIFLCNRTNVHCCQCVSFMIIHFAFCTQFCFSVNLTIRYHECRGFDFSNCCYMWMDIYIVMVWPFDNG